MSDSRDTGAGSGLTEESLQLLLHWLDPDAERAARKYEEIRLSLIKLFVWRGFVDAESFADETIDRVVRKLPEIMPKYQGDPASYFYGMAKRIMRPLPPSKPSTLPTTTSEEDKSESEQMHECLSKCMGVLSPANRELILNYYAETKQDKINARRALASKLGMPVVNLRVRVHRIRSALHTCIGGCMAAREE